MRFLSLIVVLVTVGGCKYFSPFSIGRLTVYPEGYNEPEARFERQREQFYRETPEKDGRSSVDSYQRK